MLFLASGVYSVGGRILGGNLAYYLEQKKTCYFYEKTITYTSILLYLYTYIIYGKKTQAASLKKYWEWHSKYLLRSKYTTYKLKIEMSNDFEPIHHKKWHKNQS